MSPDAETLLAEVGNQIYLCRKSAYCKKGSEPEIHTLMTSRVALLVWSALEYNGIGPARDIGFDRVSRPCPLDGSKFMGSFITVVPGDDIFFHTRCADLPQE